MRRCRRGSWRGVYWRPPTGAAARHPRSATGAGEPAMIQARKLGHLVLKVRDARASRDFYTRALGLKVAHEDLEHGAVFLSFGSQHHDQALFQLATGDPPDTRQP